MPLNASVSHAYKPRKGSKHSIKSLQSLMIIFIHQKGRKTHKK